MHWLVTVYYMFLLEFSKCTELATAKKVRGF